jgi:hypothetical protein
MKFQKLTVIVFTVLLLTACGGGGGGGSDASSTPGNQSQPGETVINGKA